MNRVNLYSKVMLQDLNRLPAHFERFRQTILGLDHASERPALVW